MGWFDARTRESNRSGQTLLPAALRGDSRAISDGTAASSAARAALAVTCDDSSSKRVPATMKTTQFLSYVVLGHVLLLDVALLAAPLAGQPEPELPRRRKQHGPPKKGWWKGKPREEDRGLCAGDREPSRNGKVHTLPCANTQLLKLPV